MSYTSWHTYGYGVNVSEIKCDSLERFRELLYKAPIYANDIENWREESEIEISSVEDYYEFDEDYRLGLAAIMKEVIMEAEGIEFTPCDDFEGTQYLLYSPSYPWELSEKEKGLTKEKIKKLLIKYFSIITDDALDVDYYQPENGG